MNYDWARRMARKAEEIREKIDGGLEVRPQILAKLRLELVNITELMNSSGWKNENGKVSKKEGKI